MTSSRDVPPAVETEPRDSGDLLVTVNWRERAAVLCVSGEIDLLTAPEFEDIVGDVVSEGPALLVVDLRKVSFLSSAGLQVLAATHQRLGERRLRVVSDTAVTSRPFTTTGLDEWIGLFPSLEKALAAPSGEGGTTP